MYRIGQLVKLKSKCGQKTHSPGPPDTQMKGCWHEGGPIIRQFADGSYLIADRPPTRYYEPFLRRATIEEIVPA